MKNLTLTLSLILGLATSVSALERVWTLTTVYIDPIDLRNVKDNHVDQFSIMTESGVSGSYRKLESCRAELSNYVLRKSSEDSTKLIVNNVFDDFKPTAVLAWKEKFFYFIECSPNQIKND